MEMRVMMKSLTDSGEGFGGYTIVDPCTRCEEIFDNLDVQPSEIDLNGNIVLINDVECSTGGLGRRSRESEVLG